MTFQDVSHVVPPAKITPPEAGRFFARPELLGKLTELSVTPGKIWVSSPGGSGKTTLVRAFLADDPRSLLWYQVDQDDQDPASVFFYLAQAVQGREAGAPPLPQLIPEYLPNLAAFCRNFFRALFTRFPEGCVLVFDDLQEGPGDQQFGPILAAAMAELSGNSTLFLLSREEPYALFARDRLNRSLAHLGWDDLRLSPTETKLFLSWSRKKAPLPQQTLERAYDLTQGWLAGLLLFQETPEEGPLPQQFSHDRIHLLFDYFAGEIFARQPTATQDFLLACSFLPTIEATMAEELTGRCEAVEILRGLIRENHFTFRISAAPEVFRFHPLFRQFLLSRATQLGSQRLAAMREQAAHLLLNSGQIEAAADLLIRAQAWSVLIEQIIMQAETLVSQGRSRTLLQWLEAVPAPLRNKNSWLRYWTGHCLLDQNPAAARQEFSSAFELFEAEGHTSGSMLAWAMVVNAIIVGWNDFDELDQWIERFDRLRERSEGYPSPEIEALMVQGICRALIWRQPTHADLPDWTARLHQLAICSNDSTFRLLAGCNLAFYHLVSGELATAQSLVAMLNSDLHSAEVTPLKKILWLATRAVLEWVLLDRTQCLATMEAGRSLIEESGVHLLDLRLFGQGVTLGLTTGDLPLARRLLDELPETPIIAALDHSFSCYLLADFSMLQGDSAKAVALAEMAVRRAKDGGSPILLSFSLAGLTLALHQDGQMERAPEVLNEGLELTLGMTYYSSLFHLLGAFFAFEKKDEEAALHLLAKGFGMAAGQGYLNFHPWRHEIMTRLCREAIAAGIEVAYVTRLATSRELDIAQSALPSLTNKEIEILSWIQEGKTSWEIAKILGITERTVKFHVGNTLRKFKASSRSQAVAVAIQEGVLNKK